MKFKLLLFILACSFLDAYASNEASDNFIKALKAFEKYSDTQWTEYNGIPNTWILG